MTRIVCCSHPRLMRDVAPAQAGAQRRCMTESHRVPASAGTTDRIASPSA
jgi:hypothetical protein